MKNSYIALAVFSMAALLVSSCETANEVQDNTFVPGENDVVFTIGNRIQTKSSDVDFTTAKVATMDLGKHGNSNFYLDEAVMSLDGYSAGPMTKGTPAYTENLGKLYKNKLGVDASGGLFGTGDVYTLTNADAMVEGGWQYAHEYDSNPWPSSGSVEFYFTMPNDMDSYGVSITDQSNGAFTFSYTSPAESTDQQDILFGYRTATKAQYEASLPAGLPVLLNHALTGVKFAAGNPDDVTIKSITIDGLYNSGECTITPVSENNYRDVTGTHTSAAAAVWDLEGATTGSFTNEYSATLQNYATSTTTGTGAEAVTKLGKFANNGEYPDSFAANGGQNNLNDADATQTFWFIPQAFEEGGEAREVTLTVTYSLKGSTTNEKPLVISLGELLAEREVEWEAGQLYTYTIRIDEVNVRIEDTVTPGGVIDADHDPKGILNSVKESVKITNTGNTDVFIRAAIVGQWVIDQNGERVIMFGFTDEINKLYTVESWYEDQFVSHTGEHGIFNGLAGYQNNTYTGYNHGADYNGWYFKDGYYYCKTSVAPGDDTPTPLFQSYQIKKIPHTRNSGVVMSKNMYFTLEIATQAISARTDDGTLLTDWEQAWIDACDIDDAPIDHTIITDEDGE